ncbi:MAG: hypothetical protein F4Y26_01245 [Gammaproteobacteria bacterium]|nr:hypothetical protein [Gammaproteobacteria bacterium]
MNGKATHILAAAALLCTLWACEQRTVESREEAVSSPHEADAAENRDATRAAFFDAIVQQVVELETRTFTLEGVSPMEAANIIDAYVYRDRPHNPGMISADRNMLSVRETADNLDRIGRVIEELNAGAGSAPETTLHFRLVEADGASETDPRIADVEAQLRKVLRFEGYRLLGEAFVTTQAGPIDQPIRTPDGGQYRIEGVFGEGLMRTGANINIVDSNRELSLTFSTKATEWISPNASSTGKTVLLRSTVNIRAGQTIVLGSARAPGSHQTSNGKRGEYHPGPQVILVLRASAATPDGNA